ncbi:MAG: prepilin-type N-terminal cleavage/methylation domain-containing protein [Candidatus Saccharibacteria bacterium]|nr:prepilin-type N-terminal cleavage/methylation domain-containing protein [Pseudorhodobacter sp.]
MKRDAESGVTLIEMLVVLSIISVAAGVLILRFSGPAALDPRAEAGRLAYALSQAAETALYSGNPSALIWTADSYRVDTFKPGLGWQPAIAVATLARGVSLRRNDGRDGPLMIAAGGIALPARLVLTSPDAAWVVDFNGLQAMVRTPGHDGQVLP